MSFPISNLSINILQEIFCKLPIRTLFQCRYVCKSWKSIIANPNFSKLHQKLNDVLLCVQGIPKMSEGLCTEQIYWLEFQGKYSYGDLFEFPIHSSFYGKFINSCNGLVCVLFHPSNGYSNSFMHISNPITGECLNLPALGEEKFCDSYICGLGFSPKTNQFKAIRIVTYDKRDYMYGNSQALADVCILGTGSWRSVGFAPHYDYAFNEFNRFYNNNVFVYGSIHWLLKRLSGKLEICAFNFDTEQFTTFPVPPEAAEYKGMTFDIDKFGDSLCMYFRSEKLGYKIEVWVMKEHGVAESWTNVHVFQDLDFVRVLKFLKNGDILLQLATSLSSYNPQNKIFTKLTNTQGPIIRNICMNTTFLGHNPSFASLKDMVAGDNYSKV